MNLEALSYDIGIVASFPDLPFIQVLITYSMKTQRGEAWR